MQNHQVLMQKTVLCYRIAIKKSDSDLRAALFSKLLKCLTWQYLLSLSLLGLGHSSFCFVPKIEE